MSRVIGLCWQLYLGDDVAGSRFALILEHLSWLGLVDTWDFIPRVCSVKFVMFISRGLSDLGFLGSAALESTRAWLKHGFGSAPTSLWFWSYQMPQILES